MLKLTLLGFFLGAVSTSRRPVIGIYPTIPSRGYLKAYEEWLAQEGADSVQLPNDFHGKKLEEIFQSINGFLIPGGGDPFGTSVQAMVQRAVKANTHESDYFPILGTCLGFEWLVDIFGNNSITSGFDAEYLALPLTFTDAARTSRTYANANRSLMSWFGKESITYNMHSKGISPESFAVHSGLTSIFNVLATDVDREGNAFVAEIEGKTLPIYGNQFHPEKIQFVEGSSIPRSAHAIAGARYLAQFFVSEAKKNKHLQTKGGVVVVV